jgi:hypothetical protein
MASSTRRSAMDELQRRKEQVVGDPPAQRPTRCCLPVVLESASGTRLPPQIQEKAARQASKRLWSSPAWDPPSSTVAPDHATPSSGSRSRCSELQIWGGSDTALCSSPPPPSPRRRSRARSRLEVGALLDPSEAEPDGESPSP